MLHCCLSMAVFKINCSKSQSQLLLLDALLHFERHQMLNPAWVAYSLPYYTTALIVAGNGRGKGENGRE